MIRTVVHKPQVATGAETANADPDASTRDKYADKLVKYVPAEVIAFYTPMYVYVRSHIATETEVNGKVVETLSSTMPLILILVTSLLGLVGYLFIRRDPKAPPSWFFYPLAAVAFLAWSIGTSSVGMDVFGMEPWWDKVVLMIGVLLVPLVDELLSSR